MLLSKTARVAKGVAECDGSTIGAWRHFFPIAILAYALIGELRGRAGDLSWREEAGFKWAELSVPKDGKTGFTLLPPEQTGIRFTNSLDEWSSAANRVLENGSGVAVGDFDRDGRPDIFLCSLRGENALYRNLGAWRFEDVTSKAGVRASAFPCRGAVFADVNGDGWLDMLVSTLANGLLCFLNDGQGQFVDATTSAGTATKFGSTTLALADVDGNGTLDLYVTNYRSEDIRDRSRIEVQIVNGKPVVAPWLRDRIMIVREGLLEFGEADTLYLNDGQGQFRPVAWTDGSFLDEAGQPLAAAPADWGLTATFRDVNGDGFPDIYVCNDYWTPDRFWLNDGKGRFRAISRLAVRHTCENSMGVDFADIDRDGHLDFLVLDMLSRDLSLRKRQALAQTMVPAAVGEISNRPQIMRNTLFHNRGDGTFEEIADYCGLPASDWSWQPVFLDVDLDGYEDLLIPAGHTRDVQDLDATLRIKSLQHPWPPTMDAKTRQEAFTREMMEHARLYPRLDLPIVAFRNLGNWRFAEVTDAWGTSAPGVHQGIALGDFDGDGDLDFAVNNLNSVCGVYRNESAAPRVAVRLRGLAPNVQGIGARVRLFGGAVPMQSQEMVSGGRYLSGFEPLLVFATGTARRGMTIEVIWRSGQVSVIPGVQANRIYEPDESAAESDPGAAARTQGRSPTPLFLDVSDRLNHIHVENPFDDFARQPLLPRKLSQLGPGVCWFDLDGDGHDDLIIGSGLGGSLAICRNDSRGGFERVSDSVLNRMVERDQAGVVAMTSSKGQSVVLAGSANYEDDSSAAASVQQYSIVTPGIDDCIPGSESCTGPLALADIDGDGTLELFVGGRVVPRRYPEAASSRIFRQRAGEWRLDAVSSRNLETVGLVSGAVWSDLDGDGLPELILACEWGPLRIFRNERGLLKPWSPSVIIRGDPPTLNAQRSTLNALTGWWNGVTTGDFDEDGLMDIIATNWGLNTPAVAETRRPLRLFYGDLLNRGVMDLIESEYDAARQAYVPRHGLDVMAAGLPTLRGQFPTFKAFSEATIEQALGETRSRASVVEATTLSSTLLLNRGDHLELVELPRDAQLAPAFGVSVADFDGDGHEDVFLGQNFFALPPRSHRLDAGRGLLLRGDGSGRFKAMPGQESGIQVYGEQRGVAVGDYNGDGRTDLVVTQNGAASRLYQNTTARPGLRIILKGPPGNPQGVGAVLRLEYDGKLGPAREIHAGSGYCSQDSAVQVMSGSRPARRLTVRWPGGKLTSHSIPADATAVTAHFRGVPK